MLRRLSKADLPQLLAIEQSVHVAPWTEDTFKACFQAGGLGWVVEGNKKIIGFILITLKEECHILNLGVAREYQRQGWGRKLLDFALQYAKQQGVGIVYLEVRYSNTRAISLYRSMDFHLIGERKGYYPTVAGNEDALIFAKSMHDE